MKRCLALATVGFLLTAVIPQSAEACSWSYKPGHSPEEIKRRNDVMVVRANFGFEEMRGEPGLNDEGKETLLNAEVVGHIEKGATRLETIHYPEREWGSCVLPATGPAADAKGTFWISERRERGRHRILYWEGQYLQPEQTQAERAMETELHAAIDRLRNCRPANSTRCYDMPRAIELIETEQEAWLAWRNAHCDVLAFGVEETSAEAQVRADCRTKLTVERTGELAKVRND